MGGAASLANTELDMSQNDEPADKSRRDKQTQLMAAVTPPADPLRAPTQLLSLDMLTGAPSEEGVPATVRQPPSLETDTVPVPNSGFGLEAAEASPHATALGHLDIEHAPVTLPFGPAPTGRPDQTLPVPPAAAFEDTLDDASDPGVPAALPFQRLAPSPAAGVPDALRYPAPATGVVDALPFQRSASSLPPQTAAAPGVLPFQGSPSSPPPAVLDALPFQRSPSSLPPPAVTPSVPRERAAGHATMIAPTGFAPPEPLPFGASPSPVAPPLPSAPPPPPPLSSAPPPPLPLPSAPPPPPPLASAPRAPAPPPPMQAALDVQQELAGDSITGDSITGDSISGNYEPPAFLGENRDMFDTLAGPGVSAPHDALPFTASASPPRRNEARPPLPQATPFDDAAAPKNLGGAFLAALGRTGFRPRPRRDDDHLWNE